MASTIETSTPELPFNPERRERVRRRLDPLPGNALLDQQTHATGPIVRTQPSRQREIAPDLEPLIAPLDHLLTCGGDTRLHLQPITLLNLYGCRAFPRPEALTFASTTATSISERAYAAAGAMYRTLVESAIFNAGERRFFHEVECLRHDLAQILGLAGKGHEIVFSPSGTDSELQTVFLAQTMLGTPLVSVITASDETGSGTASASVGRHFSSLTPLGAAVIKGDLIEGMSPALTNVGVPLRGADGSLRSVAEIDEEVSRAVEGAIARGCRVLLHVMDSSKLGWHAPSLETVDRIAARWPDSVQVVVDACQMRLSRRLIAAYLDRGYVVQITGSKFFTGPPFSGALLVPAALSARMSQVNEVPAGLKSYTTRADWPQSWTGVQRHLSEVMNIGQFLRWVAAVEEMRAYFAVPQAYRQRVLGEFASAVAGLIESRESLLLLPDAARAPDNEEFGTRTNFPFYVRRSGAVLSLADCTLIYRALNSDISGLLPQGASAGDRKLGAQLGHIGQPVAVRQKSGLIAGALRISAGARFVSGTWVAGNEAESQVRVQRKFEQTRLILDKIDLILSHLDRIKAGF